MWPVYDIPSFGSMVCLPCPWFPGILRTGHHCTSCTRSNPRSCASSARRYPVPARKQRHPLQEVQPTAYLPRFRTIDPSYTMDMTGVDATSRRATDPKRQFGDRRRPAGLHKNWMDPGVERGGPPPPRRRSALFSIDPGAAYIRTFVPLPGKHQSGGPPDSTGIGWPRGQSAESAPTRTPALFAVDFVSEWGYYSSH